MQGKKPASPEVIMEMLSERYGWTPDQIRSMDIRDIEVYLDIINQQAQEIKAQRKREK